MERRKFLFRSVQASALLLISGNMLASALPMFNPIKKKKVYFHYLLFWLRKDLSEAEVKDFENFFQRIGQASLPEKPPLRKTRPFQPEKCTG